MRMGFLMVTIRVRFGFILRKVRCRLIAIIGDWERIPKVFYYCLALVWFKSFSLKNELFIITSINCQIILPFSNFATVQCWWWHWVWRAESGLTSRVKWWLWRWWCGWCWGCWGSALTLGWVVWETGLSSIQSGVKDWTGRKIHPLKSTLWKLWKHLGQLTNIEMDRDWVCQKSSAPEIGIKVLLTGLHPSPDLVTNIPQMKITE